ncbi:MAG: septum formation initiator family protein [Tannerellaceae bacterium]|nr:septum formation initiator family protein [Tannerellaceae bacterium]MCD8264087.1 septum formation initiator family protein [Tannerellaceae bacterium]
MIRFLKHIYLKYLLPIYTNYLMRINKYVLVTILFAIIILVVGDGNLYNRKKYNDKIRSLEKEIRHYEKEIEVNSQKLRDFRTDKEGLERFAREEYHMKKPNEDLYIIKK